VVGGTVPCRDVFDVKGPFLFELFAVLSAIVHPSLFSLRVVALVAFLASVWQVAALVGRHGGPVAAWCAAVAYGIAGSAIPFEGRIRTRTSGR
jgi:hypothetical protein